MFKFMKSKKGFTLVELMIVVVIMAILVVVAVPIYNSVTDNAREKTCIDNQRQIISTVGNQYMMKGESGNGTVTLTFAKDDSDNYVIAVGTGDLTTFGSVTLDEIKASFQTVPVCGDESQTITATLTENTEGGTALVTSACSALDADSQPMHVITNIAE